MNAKEARQLTEIYLHPDIDTLVSVIDQRIEEAAKGGHSHVANPELGHLRDGQSYEVTREIRLALRKHYESRGFKWYESPKAGHPCCRALTTLSW